MQRWWQHLQVAFAIKLHKFVFRGKAPSLPLPPLQDLQNTKLTNLRALNVSPDKEQHIWGMRSNLVLPALAVTLLVGLVMLGASALMQPE